MNPELLRHLQKLAEDKASECQLEDNMVPPPQHVLKASDHFNTGKQIVIAVHPHLRGSWEHKHDFVEMVYMCAGRSTHMVNSTEIVLSQGELLLLNQHARHAVLPTGMGDITVNFIILPPFFNITLGMMGDTESDLRKFLLGCLHIKDQTKEFLHFKVADEIPIQQLIEQMLSSLVNKIQYKYSINQYAMGLLFLHLLNNTDKVVSSSKKDDLVLKILQYVDERYADGGLEELAQLLGYNANWLSTNIVQITGSSFKQLILNRRVAQAKFLLSTTTLPVLEIAKQIGYSNSTHFYKVFKERACCSPKDYRNGNQM